MRKEELSSVFFFFYVCGDHCVCIFLFAIMNPPAEETSLQGEPPRSDPLVDRSSEPVNTHAKVLLALVPILLILITFATGKPGIILLVTIVTFGPVVIWYLAIQRLLQDRALSKSFLIQQVFIGAVPAYILSLLAEVVLAVLLFLALFFPNIMQIAKKAASMGNGQPLTQEQQEQLTAAASKMIPLWKFLLGGIIAAFLVAGLVEEIAKYLMTRRYRKLSSIDVPGVLAVASAGALGLAGTEQFFYSLRMAARGNTWIGFLVSLYRAVFAFPLHIGTAFYIGIAVAKKEIQNMDTSIPLAITVAVLFHGAFDAVEMTAAFLVMRYKFNLFGTFSLMLIINTAFIIGLIWLCLFAYRRLRSSGYRAVPAEGEIGV